MRMDGKGKCLYSRKPFFEVSPIKSKILSERIKSKPAGGSD